MSDTEKTSQTGNDTRRCQACGNTIMNKSEYVRDVRTISGDGTGRGEIHTLFLCDSCWTALRDSAYQEVKAELERKGMEQ